ncbi:MAG: hypothetical protein IT583_04155 [Verrucomicrobia bacterium]|nr:hypothetical protein [Verrucomicrobiota bacterium]
MFKKLMLLTTVILSTLSLPARAAFWNNDITMLIVPREEIPLQIAQDISRRYPVLLVCYQQTHGALKLHAWNGGNWVSVSPEDYASGTFFATRPAHAILIESKKFAAPAELIPSSTWCRTANRLTSTDPRILIHLLGLHFDFPFRHWDLMARRYNYSLEQINPTMENVYWWNVRHDVVLEKRLPQDTSADLSNWWYLKTIPAPVIEPVRMDEAAPILPIPETSGATAVDITAKALKTPEAAPLVAPEIKPPPAPAVTKPAPAEKAAPVSEQVPVVKAAPIAEPAIQPAPIIESAPIITVVEKATNAIDTAVTTNPFSTGEIPAAEVVAPKMPKKPWWKF